MPKEHFPSQYTVKQIYQTTERDQDAAHLKVFRSTSDRSVIHQDNQSAKDSLKYVTLQGFTKQTDTPELQGLKPTQGNQRDVSIHLEYYHCYKIMANKECTVAIFTTAETLNQDGCISRKKVHSSSVKNYWSKVKEQSDEIYACNT